MKLCPTSSTVSSPSALLASLFSLPRPRNWPSLSPSLSLDVQSKGAVRLLSSLSHPPRLHPSHPGRRRRQQGSVQAKLRLIGLVSRLPPFCQISTLPSLPSPSSSSFSSSIPSFLFIFLPVAGICSRSAAAFAPDCAHRARKFPLFLIARVINSACSDGTDNSGHRHRRCRLVRVASGCASGGFEGDILSSICDRRRHRHRDFNAHLSLPS